MKTTDDVISQIKEWALKLRASRLHFLQNFVFEYVPEMEPTMAYLMDKNLFEDRRYRVIVHPSLESKLEAAKAQWLDELYPTKETT